MHLLQGLGFSDGAQILRRCEQKTPERQAACSLFWTLGGNQVGKGAIAGWKEVLVPNLDQIGLWPFDGTLPDLLATKTIVVAETYPGEVYGWLGIHRQPVWSKRKQHGRATVAEPLLDWLDRRAHLADPALLELISVGFSPNPDGEDQFDAVVGLFGMLDVIDGEREAGNPDDPDITRWEGWILGQEPVVCP